MALLCKQVIILKANEEMEIFGNVVSGATPNPFQKTSELVKALRFRNKGVMHPS
jgi:hypothetical protein